MQNEEKTLADEGYSEDEERSARKPLPGSDILPSNTPTPFQSCAQHYRN
jgi:hypothetical protein